MTNPATCLRPVSRAVRRCRTALLRAWLKLILGRCGKRVDAQLPFVIAGPRQVEIGDDVSFSGFLHIWGMGGVQIGNRVMIGSHVAISSLTHDPAAAVMKGTCIAKPVVIEDDAWLGAHAVILPGVRVGRGAVVAAGAVVTKDVPARMIVAGVPARPMRRRAASPHEATDFPYSRRPARQSVR
jgi:acetyltransferase-like isoleucine patch superfamily enzyme